MIYPAAPMDCDGILDVLHEVIGNRDDPQAQLLGFLVYPISKEELEDALAKPNNIVLVAKKDDADDEEIIGYLLGYSFDNWKQANPQWMTRVQASDKLLRVLNTEKCLFLFHIARKRNQPGTGKKLLARGLEAAKDLGFTYVVCDILQERPGNLISLEFFTDRGFDNEGKVMYEDGLDWGLFLYKI